MICPFEKNKNDCMLVKSNVDCQQCIQNGWNDEATSYAEEKEKFIKHWLLVSKWIETLIDKINEKKLDVPSKDVLDSWTILKACIDDILKIEQCDKKYDSPASVFRIAILEEIYERAGLNKDDEEPGPVNFN